MKQHLSFDIDFARNPYKGLYVAIEGVDGSGKSTQIHALRDRLVDSGQQVVLTSEPNDTLFVGKLIRDILFAKINVPSKAFQSLFSADRSVNHQMIVEPALKLGKVVISHRSFWTNIPYGVEDLGTSYTSQTADSLAVSTGMLSYYHEFVKPDLTFYLDVPIDIVMHRLSKMDKKKDIYERREKLTKISKGYHSLLQKYPKEIIVVDGEKPADEITGAILNKILKQLKNNQPSSM